MLSKGLRVKAFWLVKTGDKPNVLCLHEWAINQFLEENQDIEIQKTEVHEGSRGGPFLMIWYRKIDPNWQDRRGPEA